MQDNQIYFQKIKNKFDQIMFDSIGPISLFDVLF